MPLARGYDRQTISKNIRELRHSGRPRQEAVAIAYAAARRCLKRDLARPVVSGSRRRWFFWYILTPSGSWVVQRPISLSDYDAFRLEMNTKRERLGARMYRFFYDSTISPNWEADRRTDPQLLAGTTPTRGESYA